MSPLLRRIKKFALKVRNFVTGAVLAVLGALGIYVTIPEAQTGSIIVSYQRATENVDGSPLALEDIEFTRLFCNGSVEPVAEEPGADGTIEFVAPADTYNCVARHVANGGQESFNSNGIDVIISAPRPKPPVLIEE